MSATYLSSLFSLDGLSALVTGGSSGIGRAIALALARAGARVVVVGRDEERLSATAAETGGAWVAADLGAPDGVQRVSDGVVAAMGEPDILVNAAGVNLRPPLGETTDEVLDETLAVNLVAPFALGRRFGPGMAERGYGRIVNVSSQQAHRAFVTSGVYGMSKGGLEALTRSQAEAWSAQGVTANALVPGFVLTRMNTRLAADPEQVARLAARTLVGRNGQPDDFAGAAVFLASRASAYVTGQSIAVDGGFSVH
ncbi:SDR family NAD(P)-dependent oxidoreductase [Antribacter gilvus]|uniref:SDR family NAD(P)-dependent oxidoreductase n=1 Tax=Antribacter gilvus TaxID=2304675 RepID=UPI000F7B323A|nr:SDR family oxidoreductase [Antribacter gilvus]